jgi:probable blue pigment (indigoidine) exporter
MENSHRQSKNIRTVAYLAGAVAIVLWAMSPSLVKLQAMALSTLYFLFVRYLVSTVFLSPVLVKIDFRRLQLGNWFWLSSACLLSLHVGLQVIALKGMPSGLYVLAYALSPVLTLIVMQARIPRLGWLYIVFGTIGAIVFALGSGLAAVSISGLVALLISMLSWVLLTKNMVTAQAHLSDIQITSLMNVGSFLVFSALFLIFDRNVAVLRTGDWMSIVILALSIPLALFLFSFALRRVPVMAVFAQLFEPIIGVVAGYFILNEAINGLHVVGMMVVLASVYFLDRVTTKVENGNQ